jgi:uncharacterized protein YdaL
MQSATPRPAARLAAAAPAPGAAAALAALLAPASAAAVSAPAGLYDLNQDGILDVDILYDHSGPFAGLGPIYAEMLMNLLGHFPQVQAWSTPTDEYVAGTLVTAEVSIYIGSTFDGPLPQSFKDDFLVTTRPVVWLGYNLWQIGWADWNGFLFDYGFQHWYVAGNDGSGEATQFYRYVQYKGKELAKFAWWNAARSQFVNDPFVNVLYIPDPAAVQVLASIEHSGTGDVQPYVVRSGNLTHVGDIPFTYIHERDRYLAFADLLHDLIGIDHAVSRKALMRLEDVHPNVPAGDIKQVTNVMKETRTRPWNIALTPRYEDPLGYYNDGVPESFDMNSGSTPVKAWRSQINRARTYGAQLVLHGYSHQYKNVPNPYNGVSGDDFEFWEANVQAPIPEDSYSYYTGRLNAGKTTMARKNWVPWANETPHYRASTLDYLINRDVFAKVYQRAVYMAYAANWGTVYTWNEIFNNPQSGPNWSQATVNVSGDIWGGQFMPYVIQHDVYGAKVLPENIGNIEPPEFALGPQYVRTVPDLLAAADANLVNRCAFASFFFHPYLVEFPEIPDAGGQAGLRSLVQGIEGLGYTFVQASGL